MAGPDPFLAFADPVRAGPLAEAALQGRASGVQVTNNDGNN